MQHRLQTFVISQSVTAQAFELINEQPRTRGAIRPIISLTLQNQQGRVLIELGFVFLCAAEDIRLKRSEVMGQTFHGFAEPAVQQDLTTQKINRHRQPGRRQDLFVDAEQNVLRGHVLLQTFPIDPEEIGLFDVFFAIERWVGHGIPKRAIMSILPARNTMIYSNRF